MSVCVCVCVCVRERERESEREQEGEREIQLLGGLNFRAYCQVMAMALFIFFSVIVYE